MSETVQKTDLQKYFGETTVFKRKSLVIARVAEHSAAWKSKAILVEHCNDQFGTFEDGTIYGNYCRERICPLCQRRRSLKLFGELYQVAENVGGSFLLMTLTVRNVKADKLSAEIDRLLKSSSELWRSELKSRFLGAVRTLEVTYNLTAGTYHPHLHWIVSVPDNYFKSRKYISQSHLLDCWRNLLGGNNGGCDLRRIKGDDLAGAVAEVAKYAVKPFDLEDEALTAQLLDELFAQLKDRRLIQSYGNLKTSLRAVRAEREEEEKKDPHNCLLWVRWNNEKGAYEFDS